jgi:hypothetical protein
MRNGGSPPAHLPSSTATPSDPLRWLAPPQRAPELQPPVRASDAAISALAHYNKIISQRIFDQALAECAKLAVHAQQAMTALSVAMAAWQCQEDTAHAQALAKKELAEEQRCHKIAVQEKALADEANERHQAAARETALADKAHEQRQAAVWENALANEANKQRCHESAERATTLATKALAKDEYNKDNGYVARQIEAYAAPFFARVDAVMAKIRAMDDGFGNWAAFGDELLIEEDNETSAPTMPPSAPPTAMLSPHHHPKSYVDAVLTTMGGSSQGTSLPLAQAALPSPAVDGKLRTVRRCTQPCCRVGCCHSPRAPNPQERLLHGRQHQPRTPNQSTVNGWA